MTAQLLRFPQERVSDAGRHEARILSFPKPKPELDFLLSEFNPMAFWVKLWL